ncbi:MBL fold metallo-hydrolase [Nakamurella lactea]|uniref:MBL fold metallo-hydrolase n=1 Tax=Nakamurella lactea TaxID=459515 RepID=UPI0004162375|nr:MBL fold metallo-hydrolase [Nakamurella lactea]
MEITKYGHACLQVRDGDANILIDPGTFSAGFENLTGLTAILVTHVHADHLDTARFGALAAANPQVAIHAEAAAVEELAKVGVTATVATAGQRLDVGTPVEPFGELHAVIHADLPRFGNIGYLIGGRLLHPGDALTVPDFDVEILAVPTMAPWMALKEAIDFERAVAPKVAIPIHEALLRNTDMYYGRLEHMGPAGLRLLNLDDGHTEQL